VTKVEVLNNVLEVQVSNLRGEAANWKQQKLNRVVVAGKII